MDYSQLQLRTVVDWIEFEIRTTEAIQAWRIRDALKGAASYVAGYDEITGEEFARNRKNTPTTLFRFRIHDPASFHHVKKILMQVACNFTLQSPPNLTAIEIALDTYCTGGNYRQLAEIAADRYRFSTCIPGDAWYFYRTEGEGRRYISTLENRTAIMRHFENGWQLTDRNNKYADVRYHAYVKAHDSGKPLPVRQHRARFEVTLTGAALPCKTLEDLERMDFTKLADYFKFRRLSDDLHPAAKYVLTQWSGNQLGRRGAYRRMHKTIIGKHSGGSVFRGSTAADAWLNREALEQLRTLTRHWRSKRGMGRSRASADFSEGSERQPRMDTGNSSGVLIISTDTHSYLNSLSPELVSLTPELEVERERIDKLMDFDRIPPHPHEAKS